MKKFLFVIICCVLCVSFNVSAKEYKLEETKECYDGLLCDLDGNLITGTLNATRKDILYETSYVTGKKEGIEKGYYDIGLRRKLASTTPYKNGKEEGISKVYSYENGNVIGEWPYKNGKEDGVERMYYENGNLESEAPYTKGKINGLVKTFYENGNLKTEEFYKDGKKEGLLRMYHKNGNLLAEMNYKNGELNGLVKTYMAFGDFLMYEVSFDNGQAISGSYYDIVEEKRKKMNNAHLYNFMKDFNLK